MKSTWWWVIGILVVIIIGWLAYTNYGNGNQANAPSTANVANESAVRATVTQFGQNLKQVSLLAATSTASAAMAASYGPYVNPTLLAQWESNPMQAPGRLTSSPSPDRIDITSLEANADGSYTVNGNVVETTSADASSTAGAGSYPVTVTLSVVNGAWLITSFTGYPPQHA